MDVVMYPCRVQAIINTPRHHHLHTSHICVYFMLYYYVEKEC